MHPGSEPFASAICVNAVSDPMCSFLATSQWSDVLQDVVNLDVHNTVIEST